NAGCSTYPFGSSPRGRRGTCSEETTSLFRHLRSSYPGIVGFEYALQEASTDARERPSRLDDLTSLTFGGETFDAVLTFDVFEHIPDVMRAFAECFRVLRPGGLLFFSVPFLFEQSTSVPRARIGRDGRIVHLAEPEYHADPRNSSGCLTFWNFG